MTDLSNFKINQQQTTESPTVEEAFGNGAAGKGVVRAALQPDGSFKTEVETVTRGGALQAAQDAGRVAGVPWDYALHPQTKTPLAPHQVTGESIIRVNGVEVTLDQAVMAGFITRPNQGGIQQAATPQGVAQQQNQQPKEAEPIHPDLQTEAVSKEGEEAFATLTEFTSGMTRIAAIQELATGGEISEARMAEAASQMGVEPAQVQAMVQMVRPELEAQADKVASQHGVDPADVWEWAREARPREMQEAITRHLTLRNTHGYHRLAEHFVQHLDTINPDAILSAEVVGGKVERTSGGMIVLTDSTGRRMTWQQWLAMGGKPQRRR